MANVVINSEPITASWNANKTWGGYPWAWANLSGDKIEVTIDENVVDIGEDRKKQYVKNISVNMDFNEQKDGQEDYQRNIGEALNIGVSFKKEITKVINEEIGINDYFIYPYAYSIISDIALRNIPFSEDDISDLTTMSKPTGFSDWQPFLDGDYTHKEALFKTTLINASPESIIGAEISAHKIICDVYDVIESGTSSVSGESTRIYFAKTFHADPVVTPTSINSSEFAIAEIITTTKSYFDARLKTSGGVTSGTIGWQAHGY